MGGDNGTQVKLQRFKEILTIVPKEEVSEGKCLSSDVREGTETLLGQRRRVVKCSLSQGQHRVCD